MAGVELGSRGLSMAFVSPEVRILSCYPLAHIAPLTHMPQHSSWLHAFTSDLSDPNAGNSKQSAYCHVQMRPRILP